MNRHSSYLPQRGFMLIEAIVFISVLLSLMSLGMRFIIKNAEHTVNQVAAQQLQQVTQAAQYYVRDHYQDFKNNPDLTLNWQQLVDTGYLANLHPTKEPAESGKNHYGQNYVFTVREEKGVLQLLLTTEGGNPIDERSLRQIAALAGSAAGYASVLDNGKIVGNQQSWVLDGIPLQPGHLASLTLVNEKEVMDAATFLRRIKIEGHPEYNTMETSLTITDQESPAASRITHDDLQFYNTGDKESIITLSAKDKLIVLQNQAREWSTQIYPAEIHLESQASGNKSYIRNDRIVLNNTRQWSTEILPAQVRLENPSSGRKTYVGNDEIVLSNKYNESLTLKPGNLSLGNQIMVDNNFIKLPVYFVDDLENHDEIEEVVNSKVGCDDMTEESLGRLFVVGDNISNDKYLGMCIWRLDSRYTSYVIINKNEIAPKIVREE